MLKPITTVLTGTVLAQGIALLFLPIISRTYAPAEFGGFQLVASSLALLMPIAALRLDFAILRLRSPSQLPSLLALCGLLNIAGALLILAVQWLVLPWLFPASQGQLWAGWMLPAGFLAAGLFQTLSYVPVRNKRYRMMSISKVAQSGLFHAISALSGWILSAPGAIVLVGTDIVSRAIASGLIIADTVRGGSMGRISIGRMVRLLRVYRNYPLYSMPASVIGAIVAAAPVVWLSLHYGTEAAGQFGMAWRTTFQPLAMLVYAIAQVISADLSQRIRHADGGGRRLILRVTGNMLLIGGPLVLIAGWFGQPLLALALGPGWAEAGRMLTAMTPLLLASLISGPINMALVISGRPAVQFGWECCRAALVIGVLLGGGNYGLTAVETVALFSASMFLMALAFLMLAIFWADRPRARSRR